jgi:hypothetical protein
MAPVRQSAHRPFCGAVLAVVLFSTISFSTAAQAQEQLTLRIVGPDDNPIEAAEVGLDSSGDPAFETAEEDVWLTDAVGEVNIELAEGPRGTLTYTVAAVGFIEERVEIAPGTVGPLIVRLQLADGSEDEIVVTGKSASRPFSPQTLDLFDIVTDARSGADPILAVNNLPSSTNVAGNAALNLRAARSSISRLYLNDVPLFEFIRGSGFDSVTQGGSILNLGNTQNIEVYPSNPPLYLAGSSGGAVRALPPTSADPAMNLTITTASLSATKSFAGSNNANFLTLSGLYSDFQPQLALNGSLSKLISKLQLRSIALIGHADIGSTGEAAIFAQAESDQGAYPIEILGSTDEFLSTSRRGRVVGSFAHNAGPFVVTLNGAYSRSRSRENLSDWSSKNSNRYSFLSLDMSSTDRSGDISYRVGIDLDNVKQESRETIDGTQNPLAFQVRALSVNKNSDAAIYAFISHVIDKNGTFSAGLRKVIISDLSNTLSGQVNATLNSEDKIHKIILSAGRCSGIEIPLSAYYGGVSRSVSNQISFDYSFRFNKFQGGLSAYYSYENSSLTRSVFTDGRFFIFDDNLTGVGRKTKTTGVEIYGTFQPVDELEAKLSVTSIRQIVLQENTRFRGSNDFGYIFRSSISYVSGDWTTNLTVASRQGSVFTFFEDFAVSGLNRQPILSDINGSRLPSYFSIDTTMSKGIKIGKRNKILGFIAVNNILNKYNPTSQIFDIDPSETRFRTYPKRYFTAGLSINF